MRFYLKSSHMNIANLLVSMIGRFYWASPSFFLTFLHNQHSSRLSLRTRHWWLIFFARNITGLVSTFDWWFVLVQLVWKQTEFSDSKNILIVCPLGRDYLLFQLSQRVLHNVFSCYRFKSQAVFETFRIIADTFENSLRSLSCLPYLDKMCKILLEDRHGYAAKDHTLVEANMCIKVNYPFTKSSYYSFFESSFW